MIEDVFVHRYTFGDEIKQTLLNFSDEMATYTNAMFLV